MPDTATSSGKRHTDADNAVPILYARNLTKTFRMGDSEVTVLKDAALTLKRGEFVAIEGRSGSGKSTLLHILGALDEADEGSIDFNGVLYGGKVQRPRWLQVADFVGGKWMMIATIAVTVLYVVLSFLTLFYQPMQEQLGDYLRKTLEEDQMQAVATGLARSASFATAANIGLIGLACVGIPVVAAVMVRLVAGWLRDLRPAHLRNREFGFVFQSYHLLPELNVLENTLVGQMAMHGPIGYLRRRGDLRTRAKEILKQLGLEHRMQQKPGKLSGGERQRVAIARALMNQPKILFADEPTGNLDATTGRQIMNVLEELHQKQGQTIVMVTHDRALAREADRVLVLRNGKLEKAE